MLLSYSISYCQNDVYECTYSSLRGDKIDSIKISMDDLRTVNDKLIDAEINKQKIEQYEYQVTTYAKLVEHLNDKNEELREDLLLYKKKYKKENKAKKIYGYGSLGLGVCCILLIL